MPNTVPDTTAYAQLIGYLSDCTDKQRIDAVMSALLTDYEIGEVNNRLRIFQLLDAGMTQRDISETLGVGIATVSRGAKAYREHQVGHWLSQTGL